MRDPYLYDDVPVLKNRGNIKDAAELKKAEGDVTKYTLAMAYAQKHNKFTWVCT